MMKDILVVYYSQTGQLKQIAQNLVEEFSPLDFSIEWLEIEMKNNFPFPWTSSAFYNVMPECVLGIPSDIAPLNIEKEHYDLILFAYQPWFLSPSIPAISILNNPEFIKIIKNTPVITVIGARNMWIGAQERIKALLNANGANLVGNIVLEDKNLNLLSAVTIQYWLYTGKKERLWGIFPIPGISDEDIESSKSIGKIVSNHLIENRLPFLQSALIHANAVKVHTNLRFIESRGALLFSIWAKTIIKKRNRALWLKAFKYYLVTALFLLSPIVVMLYTIFYKPFFFKTIKRKNSYFLGVNN